MASPNVNRFLDDSDSAFTTGPSSWTVSRDTRWAGGTQRSPESATDAGEVTLSFRGTGVAFIGTTPPISSSQTFFVTIDDHAPYETSFPDQAHDSYRQWYQSPKLSDDLHVIKITNISAGASIDYAVTTVGQSGLIFGYTLIVDDSDDKVEYTGSWIQDSSAFSTGSDGLNGFPYCNSTRRSTTPGDTARIEFSGDTIAAFGVLEMTGSVTVSFTIDDLPAETRTYASNSSSILANTKQPNFEWFSRYNLGPGLHSLFINVTESHNQPFTLDYFLYNAGFENSPQKPVGSATPYNHPPPMNSTAIGIILSVLSGTLLMVICLVILLKRRRRRKLAFENDGSLNLDIELRSPSDHSRLHSRSSSSQVLHIRPEHESLPPIQNAITVNSHPTLGSSRGISPFPFSLPTPPSMLPSTSFSPPSSSSTPTAPRPPNANTPISHEMATDMKRKTLQLNLNNLIHEANHCAGEGQSPSMELMQEIADLKRMVRYLAEKQLGEAGGRRYISHSSPPPSYEERWLGASGSIR